MWFIFISLIFPESFLRFLLRFLWLLLLLFQFSISETFRVCSFWYLKFINKYLVFLLISTRDEVCFHIMLIYLIGKLFDFHNFLQTIILQIFFVCLFSSLLHTQFVVSQHVLTFYHLKYKTTYNIYNMIQF